MPCEGIAEILVSEAGRYLPDQILRQPSFAASVWRNIWTWDTWPQGLGPTINILTYENSAPTSASPTRTPVTPVDGQEGGLCLPPVEEVNIASTTRQMTLNHHALHSPPFCANNLLFPFQVMQQLNAIVEKLADYTKLVWEQWMREDYFRWCETKVVVDGCPPHESTTTATSYPAFQATSPLSQGILDRYYVSLIRKGATGMGQNNGAPVLTLICSMETSDNILRTNSEIVQDLRWGQPNLLLQSLGVTKAYKGFFHVYDNFPRRFTYAGGVYTQVAPFALSAATVGQKAVINSAWLAAPYEESFIYSPSVTKYLVPTPVTNAGGGVNFKPQNYTGEWSFRIWPNEQCNPDGNIGKFRGVLMAAAMPVYPTHGVAFVHLRCDPACGLIIGCSA
jgi:hypothetical protein